MRTITIEVDDFVYEWAERLAAESGAPVEYHVMELLVKYGRNWLPKMTPDEYEQQMARLRRHAGAQDLGYPTGADNEAIDRDILQESRERLLRYAGIANSGNPNASDNDSMDADLAREYMVTHD